MFDFRYHVASLTAVLLALVIGILVGVGISGRGFVDEAERRNLNDRIAELSNELQAARDRSAGLLRQQSAARDFVEEAYPVLADRRLDGKRVAVVVAGSIDRTVDAAMRAVRDAGGRIVRVRALTVPLEDAELQRTLERVPALGGYVGEEHLRDVGRDLGREVADGGEAPLWSALAGVLVEERLFERREPADGVVLVRTADPQAGATARFLAALYAGARSTGVPVVGVERSDAAQSALPVFRRQGVSTVAGIETPAGRLALVLLLAGAEPGDYGTGAGAGDGLLPPIEPLPAADG